ncbi:family 43 glycosylhydrolase [uncultured Chitinophaga sp.]|uniref:family 43 glycosylhydrolase n=1 Tax=uncultured Chitinophaga sp. TaxID=339340 RepID=UPI0025E47EE2|nr:family 43 glycosylhydrolase [uncultured Chitinophaga sp.]
MSNPIIRHIYTADPTVLVYNNTVYLYTGHDEPPDGVDDYVMNDWRCFSSTDLQQWAEHPVPLKALDFAWSSGNAYASKVIEFNGKFYWFVAVTNAMDGNSAIGLAVADRPQGPYTDALGAPLITLSMLPPTDNPKANLDPTVLYADGAHYVCWGHQTPYFARLNAPLTALDGPITTLTLPNFSEGAHLHKHKDWFYLSYGYGSPEKVAYAMSRDINGPWEFKGILNDVPYNCETNRPCTLEMGGESYFFYHNGALPGGGSHRRSVCIDRLYYNDDGTIQEVVMTR